MEATSDPGRQRSSSATKRSIGPADYAYFRRKLQARLPVLRAAIQNALLRGDSEQHTQIAGQVHDAEEDALADLLVDVNLAEISRDVQEVRDIDAAQRRILLGTYGSCVDCEEPIDWARQDAYPTAKRCLSCQQQYERTRVSASTPSL